MQKYVTKFSFAPETAISAYLLGLIWSDGWVLASGNGFALASKDPELTAIASLFYPGGRPLYSRKDGVSILAVYANRVVKELQALGFHPKKSLDGIPIFPRNLAAFFLGIVDGDGCVSTRLNRSLRIAIAGSQDFCEALGKKVDQVTGIELYQGRRYPRAQLTIQGRAVKVSRGCGILQTKSSRDAEKLLHWGYAGATGAPFFARKRYIFEQYLAKEMSLAVTLCPLCGTSYDVRGTTGRYCRGCRVLLRRLRNRQQDHLARDGYKKPLHELLLPHEQHYWKALDQALKEPTP